MAHELWVVKGDAMTDMTMMVGSISWRSNVDELGDELSFDIATSGRYLWASPCDIGDLVILKNKGREIIRAIVTDEGRNGENPISYTAYDYAFYLNKSNAVYQFKNMRADQCIRKILKDFGVPVGNIAQMPTPITKIFNDVTVSDIIREILEIVRRAKGTKYLMEIRAGKMYIEPQDNQVVRAHFQLYDEGLTYDYRHAISNPSKTRSIKDMVNAVQIVNNEDKLVHTGTDNAMIQKYGRLQKVVTLDQDEKRSAAVIAKNELNRLSRISEEVGVEFPGDDSIRAGRLLMVEEHITQISGRYLITNVTHNISGGHHTMSLGLEAR